MPLMRIIFHAAIFFLVYIAVSYVTKHLDLKRDFSDIIFAGIIFLAIVGIKEWSNLLPFLNRIFDYINRRKSTKVGFVCFVFGPSVILASYIVYCQTSRYLYKADIYEVAERLYQGNYGPEFDELVSSVFDRYPTRKELALLISAKSASLRISHDDTKFRKFNRHMLSALYGLGQRDINELIDVSNDKMIVSSWWHRICLCSSPFSDYDPVPLFVRLVLQGYKYFANDNHDLAKRLLGKFSPTPVRQGYKYIIDLEPQYRILRQSILGANSDASMIFKNATDIAKRLENSVDELSNSDILKAHDLYQQMLDYLAQYEIYRCHFELMDKSSSTTADSSLSRIQSIYLTLLEQRAKVLVEWKGSILWNHPPEKLMLYWHILERNGGKAKYGLHQELEELEQICPTYKAKLFMHLEKVFEFVGEAYSETWKEGTIAVGSLSSATNRFVASGALENGWRY